MPRLEVDELVGDSACEHLDCHHYGQEDPRRHLFEGYIQDDCCGCAKCEYNTISAEGLDLAREDQADQCAHVCLQEGFCGSPEKGYSETQGV